MITPTRNRAALWHSGWSLDGLLAQSDQDFDHIIIDDHSEDDTLAFLTQELPRLKPRHHTTVITALAPRPGPFPASDIPDNCGYHAATGSLVLHLDDDLATHPDLVAYCKLIPHCPHTPRIVWAQLEFRERDGSTPAGHDGQDSRCRLLARLPQPQPPLGLVRLPTNRIVHWGGAFTVPLRTIRELGGCDLTYAGLHSGDTRLGSRLVRAHVRSYLSTDPRMRCRHLGLSWWKRTANTDPQLAARFTARPNDSPILANGGRAFWTSPWFDNAYKVVAQF